MPCFVDLALVFSRVVGAEVLTSGGNGPDCRFARDDGSLGRRA